MDITKDGYILLGKSAEEAWTKMAMQPREYLENKIDINKELLTQAKEADTTVPIRLKPTYNNFDDLIAHYQKYKSHVQGITNDQEEILRNRPDCVSGCRRRSRS